MKIVFTPLVVWFISLLILVHNIYADESKTNVLSYYAITNQLDGQPMIDMNNVLRFYPVFSFRDKTFEVHITVYKNGTRYHVPAVKNEDESFWEIKLPPFELGEAIQRIEAEVKINTTGAYGTALSKYRMSLLGEMKSGCKGIDTCCNYRCRELRKMYNVISNLLDVEKVTTYIETYKKKKIKWDEVGNKYDTALKNIRSMSYNNDMVVVSKPTLQGILFGEKVSDAKKEYDAILLSYRACENTINDLKQRINFYDLKRDTVVEKIIVANFDFEVRKNELKQIADDSVNISKIIETDVNRDSLKTVKERLSVKKKEMEQKLSEDKEKNIRLEITKKSYDSLRSNCFIELNQKEISLKKYEREKRKILYKIDSLQNISEDEEFLTAEYARTLAYADFITNQEKELPEAVKVFIQEMISDTLNVGNAIKPGDITLKGKKASLFYRNYKRGLRNLTALDPAERLGIFRLRYIPFAIIGKELVKPVGDKPTGIFEVGMSFGDPIVTGDDFTVPPFAPERLGVAFAISNEFFSDSARVAALALTYDFNSYGSLAVGTNFNTKESKIQSYLSFGINKKAFEGLVKAIRNLFN